MTFDPMRNGRSNRDRRDQSFAQSVIARAEQLRRENTYIGDLEVEAFLSNPPTVTPESLAQAETLIDQLYVGGAPCAQAEESSATPVARETEPPQLHRDLTPATRDTVCHCGHAWHRHFDGWDGNRLSCAETARRIGPPQGAAVMSEPDEQPLGECPHCGTEYFTESERQYHAGAECIGAEERFR